MLNVKTYDVFAFDGAVLGQVKARNGVSAKSQAKLMFPLYASMKAQGEAKAPRPAKAPNGAVAYFNDWSAGVRAAFTKAVRADLEKVWGTMTYEEFMVPKMPADQYIAPDHRPEPQYSVECLTS